MPFPWCVMRMPAIPAGTPKGAILDELRWPKGSSITFGFLDGDPALCDRVDGVAREWLQRTGAKLIFERRRKAETAAIRISFRYNGSWSMLGRGCLSERDGAKPTMNFGWLEPTSTDAEVRGVVLHEVGHALGFIHEHQNPDGGIRWREDVVIKALSGPPNSWPVDQIRQNVLDGFDPRELIGTPFDKDSIMLYPFPAEWTVNGISTHSNGDLSAQDIELARRVYA